MILASQTAHGIPFALVRLFFIIAKRKLCYRGCGHHEINHLTPLRRQKADLQQGLSLIVTAPLYIGLPMLLHS